MTFRERLAKMTKEEIAAAWRATAEGDRRRKEQGLLEIVDDREEAFRIMQERLPVLMETCANFADKK